MAEVVLLHGGLHGAWCFDYLRPELELFGHRTAAIDMPIDRVGAALDDYADAVVAAIEGQVGERPWVLGHSLGGMVIPRVALRRPVAGLLFLCAGIPPLDVAQHEENQAAFAAAGADEYVWDDQGRIMLPPEVAARRFYGDCSPEVQAWAAARLRAQWAEAFGAYLPIARWPEVPCRAILTREDALLGFERYRALFEARLGVTPAGMPGSHSPFLSRPGALARLIDDLIASP